MANNMNNKVYVNPNFNSLSSNNRPSITKKVTLHVNPKFSQQIPQNSSRIYVNPNFVKAKVNNTVYHNSQPNFESIHNEMKFITPTVNVSNHTPVQPNTSIARTRYSLVRHNGNTGTLVQDSNTVKSTTVKINKYKSVAINNYKKNLNTVKPSEYSQISNPNDKSSQPNLAYKHTTYSFKLGSNTQKCFTNKYKMCKDISTVKLNKDLKLLNKSLSIRKVYNLKIKANRSTKINNIPCPLYKKYGKCLRRLNGTCGFLHDKRHVVICRKFLKGICHEKNCLLSHDITSNKMPTCYFYLKGLCTKDDCPYLHVKLSEKTKICPDFLKGYCEKGDTCLNRHVHVYSNATKFNKINSKKLLNSSKISKLKVNSAHKLKNNTVTRHNTKNQVSGNTSTKTPPVDCRYYQEVTINADTAEDEKLIKPSRCKLGLLPSFIKL